MKYSASELEKLKLFMLHLNKKFDTRFINNIINNVSKGFRLTEKQKAGVDNIYKYSINLNESKAIY